MRRRRDAKEAAASPPNDPGRDKPTRIVEKAVESETPLPDMEKGRPKDTGRMGA